MSVASRGEARRVKVYKLDDAGEWQDKGTGFVECLIDANDEACIVVRSEQDKSLLLHSKISHEDDKYHRQQETLIVWSESDEDNEDGTDLALSFQDLESCNDIWEEIADCQTAIKSLAHNRFFLRDADVDLLGNDLFHREITSIVLPPADMEHLEEIRRCIVEASNDEHKAVADSVTKTGYLRKLFTLWGEIVQTGDKEKATIMFYIVKQLVLFNHQRLLEELVSDEYVYDTMAALEHDPESGHGRIKHSEFLRNKAQFKEVVPLKDPDLVKKIHETFRLQYLKDVALARAMDEPTFATLTSMVFYNNVQIVSAISSNEKVVEELFEQLKSPSISPESLHDQLAFIEEMCELSKPLEQQHKSAFHQHLCKNGLFEVLEKSLTSDATNVRLASVDVLLASAEHDPSHLRSFMLRQQPDHNLFRLLVTRIDEDPETGVTNLLTDVIRLITNLTAEDVGKSQEMGEFLNLFYQRFAQILFSPLSRPLPKVHTDAAALLKNNLCDLLSHFITHHRPKVSAFLLQQSLVKQVLNLLNCREKWLKLAAIRFFRTFVDVATLNSDYMSHIVSEELLDPIIEVFLQNGDKYNLINSAVLELIDFIRKKNIKPLVQNLVDRHYDKLEHITYVDSIQKLKEQYNKNAHQPLPSAAEEDQDEDLTDPSAVFSGRTGDIVRRIQRKKFLEERAEESWFDEDDNDDDEDKHDAYNGEAEATNSDEEDKENKVGNGKKRKRDEDHGSRGFGASVLIEDSPPKRQKTSGDPNQLRAPTESVDSSLSPPPSPSSPRPTSPPRPSESPPRHGAMSVGLPLTSRLPLFISDEKEPTMAAPAQHHTHSTAAEHKSSAET